MPAFIFRGSVAHTNPLSESACLSLAGYGGVCATGFRWQVCFKMCAVLKNQIRERPVSFCLLISILLFEELRVKLVPWDGQLCGCAAAEAVGSCVPSWGGSSYQGPSSLDSAACPNQI